MSATETRQAVDADAIRAVIERTRSRRDLGIACAALEEPRTTKVSCVRFFRYYGLAIMWSDVVDDLLAALGEPKDGLTLPWEAVS